MANPNKQIRGAIVQGLKILTGLEVYENSIPLDDDLPNQYIVISSQGKRKTNASKGCFDFMVSVTLNLISVNEKGYNSGLSNDDLEVNVFNFLESFKAVGVHINDRDFINTLSTVIEMPDHTINQTNIVYEIWTAN